MKLLVVADVEERLLYDCFRKERFADIDLIVACGDLRAGYLDFLMTMINKPMLYVMGNHDDKMIKNPPLGATSLEDTIVKVNGYNFAGLGGCIRYNARTINMYTQKQMAWRAFWLGFKSVFKGGIDVFVTHSPAEGYGDLEDFPHHGFKCFNKLLNFTKPKYMLHGHVHTNYNRKIKTSYEHPSGCTIINACGYKIIELPDKN